MNDHPILTGLILGALMSAAVCLFADELGRDEVVSSEVCREAKNLPDGWTRLRMCVPRYMYEDTYRAAWAAEDAKAAAGTP